MMQGWKRMLTVALALVLALSVLPQAPAKADAVYGQVTDQQVFVRKEPSTGADYWFRVDTGHVAEILDTVTKNGGELWYKVSIDSPDNGNAYIGYILGDYFTPVADGATMIFAADPYAISTIADTTGNTPVSGVVGEIKSDETNFRQAASTTSSSLMKLDRGTIVELTSIPTAIDDDHWFGIRYAGLDGYVMASYVRQLTDGGSLGNGMMVNGYVKLTKSTANLRSAPGGSVSVANGWKKEGDIKPYVSTPVSTGGYTWYEIVVNGTRYWVRSDVLQTVDSTGKSVNPPQAVQSSGSSSSSSSSSSSLDYVLITQGGTNLRLQPFGESITQIKKGLVLPCTSVVAPYSKNNNSSYTWYYVTYNNIRGYVRSDCAKPCDVTGSTVDAPTVTASPSVGSSSYGYVKMTKGGVNVRQTPGGKSLEQLAKGVVVPVTGSTRSASNYTWYPIKTASGKSGYVRGDCVTPCDATGSTGSSGSSSGSTGSSSAVYGYVEITMNKTNIRNAMSGSVMFQVAKKGGVYPMWGAAGSKGGYTWYPIIVDGKYGWVRGDCAKVVSVDGSSSSSSGSSGSTSSATTQYVIMTEDDVKLRESASKESTLVAELPQGTVLAYNGTTTSEGVLWYRVIYNNRQAWVLSTSIRVMTQAEYDAWLKDHPSSAPQTSVIMGYVKTTAASVNIRDAAGGHHTGKTVEKKGTILPFTQKTIVDKVSWYYIETSTGFRGWLNGGFVTETDASGAAVATQAPSSGSSSGSSGSSGSSSGSYVPPTAGQEASYPRNLKYGSSGDDVRAMVTELKAQGFYSGAITDYFSTAVENAVKAFQKAKGLTVDGIAGPNTLHALYQTVPVGTGSSSTEFTMYPAEKIDWFTGGIQEIWAKGTNAKVYDVWTGIVWTAHRWSGYNHADVEPLTAADTARICQMYGVTSASQIVSNKHYTRRPCLVQIGTHNYAASLYGVPHNPSGDTIPNNDMTGQICIHFTNSRTSDSNQVDSGHQAAIEEAYQKYK